jgi:hypothetical protein
VKCQEFSLITLIGRDRIFRNPSKVAISGAKIIVDKLLFRQAAKTMTLTRSSRMFGAVSGEGRPGNAQIIRPRQYSSFVPRSPLTPVSYLPLDEHVGSQSLFSLPDPFLSAPRRLFRNPARTHSDCFACFSFQIDRTNLKITATFKENPLLNPLLCLQYHTL